MGMTPEDRERLRNAEAEKGKKGGRPVSLLTSFMSSEPAPGQAPEPGERGARVPLLPKEAHPPLPSPGFAVRTLPKPKPPQDFRMAETMDLLVYTASHRLKLPPPPRQMTLKLDLDLWAYFSMESLRRDDQAHEEARPYSPTTRTDLVLDALAWRNDEMFRASHYAGLALEMDARRAAVGFKKWNGQVPGVIYQALGELHRRVRREVKQSPREITMTSLAEGLLLAWAQTNFQNPFDPQYPYASEGGGEEESFETPQSSES